MKKLFGSLRTQTIIFSLVGFIIVQATLVSNYFQFRELKIQDNRVRYQELLSQVSRSVETSCTYFNEMLEQIAYNDTVQEYLNNPNSIFQSSRQKQIQSLLGSLSKLRSGIKDIAVLDSNENCTNLKGNIYQIQELAGEIPEGSLYYYTGLKNLRFSQAQMVEGFVVGAKVYSTSDFTRDGPIGTVLISFTVPSIFESVDLGENEDMPAMLIFDRDENLVLSSAPEGMDLSYATYFNSDRGQAAEELSCGDDLYYIESGDLEMLGGKIVFLISQRDVLSGMDELRRQMVVFAFCAGFVLVLFFFVATYRIVHPLNQFMKWMDTLKKGDFSLMGKPLKLRGATEAEAVAEQFNDMMREVTELTHNLIDTTSELYESELGKQQAELEYLYSQVNPHFLFNTLESVKGCAIEEGAPRTFKMVTSLGKIFQYCIRSGDLVKMRDELSVADNYMFLQQIRFEDRLMYLNRVSEDILDVTIPKLILQPLLENAVVHGVEENGATTVWLDGWRSDGDVILTVTDDGNQISKEKLEELKARLNENGRSAHIGISNIHTRLRTIYGDPYGLELMELDRGFGARIRLPLNGNGSAQPADAEEGAREYV